jgi:glucose-1-phosphate thymidylyltransferase
VSLKEIALYQDFINGPQLEQAIVKLGKSDYGRYLRY